MKTVALIIALIILTSALGWISLADWAFWSLVYIGVVCLVLDRMRASADSYDGHERRRF